MTTVVQASSGKPAVRGANQDVQAYAAWAGKELPTEAESEYAARGGLARPCCAARNPRGAREEASYDPCQPQIEIPRKVFKGGSHLCAPNDCRRYRRHAQPIDTSTGHVGFRCVRHEAGPTS